ncbi:MAG: hypothetical protein ACR2HG_01255 [Pyrinomonadaceae bacterium]
MKFLYLGLALFLSAVGVTGQTLTNPSDAAGVEVIQKRWRVEFRNPALDEDPFRGVNEHNQQESDRKENLRSNAILSSQGKPQQIQRDLPSSPRAVQSDAWTSYVYEVKLKNSGGKEIRSVTWEYVFFEAGTQKEVGRRQFETKVSIDPGKTKTLIAHSSSPPTETVNVAKADKKMRDQYAEQIAVQSIEYADGSVWKSAAK